MLYIVSGLPRSGTSAMMGALKAGGMEVNAYPEMDERDIAIYKGKEYHPNPLGFFEGGKVAWWDAHGQVTKVTFPALEFSGAKEPVLAIAMYRPLLDRRKSALRMEPRPPNIVVETTEDWRLAWKRAKRGMDNTKWIVVDFYEFVDNPRLKAERLIEAGWPIKNVDAFVGWVDPDLCRNRS